MTELINQNLDEAASAAVTRASVTRQFNRSFHHIRGAAIKSLSTHYKRKHAKKSVDKILKKRYGVVFSEKDYVMFPKD